MRSAKFIGLFAACGFILSFVAGLFSHSSILSVLLKALIFAVIFGALGSGITVVFSKFLSDGYSGEVQGEYSAEAATSPVSSSALGHNVDITIQDEELKPSESENHFVVGDSHQMLNDSDVRSPDSSSDYSGASQGFVPLRNFETVKNFSGTESVIPADAVASQNKTEEAAETVNAPAASFTEAGGGEGGIDTLPDMENLVFSEGAASGSDDDDSDSETDSEFVSSVSSRKNDGPAEVQDAALMAKAISSVLSDENS